MSASTALARVLVEELVSGGMSDVVLSPGSRNAPIAFACYDAERAGRLRVLVRIDERTAGFLALGLAKASGRPVAAVTTSGTAAVNLHPAVVEADYAGVRMVAVTADRPAELRGVGANQTIDQTDLFGSSVRAFLELSIDTYPNETTQRHAVAAAMAQASTVARGPVHLNVGLREPLVPEPGERPPFRSSPPAPPQPISRGPNLAAVGEASLRGIPFGPRTVVVAGDGAGWEARWVAEVAGWPLLAEPSSNVRVGANALATYRLLLDRLGSDIERVVLFGRPTLSRAVSSLLARPEVELLVVPGRGRDVRPGGRDVSIVAPLLDGLDKSAGRTKPDPWSASWLTADDDARAAVAEVLADEPLNGITVARAVAENLPPGGLLVAGSSSAVRDLDLAAPWDEPLHGTTDTGDRWDGRRRLVLANRGASGIDGTVSTAVGAALAHGRPAYALMGDLTFLHDSTGLVIGPDEPRPDLTIVVVNDDGGGLFTQLEQGAPAYADEFERLFGAPHGVDLAALCAATGTPHQRVGSLERLTAELARPPVGIRVVEVPVDRGRTRDLHTVLRAAVDRALG